jgi:hypothetical protein
MEKKSKLPAHDEPLMAQAVADAVGATKRQVQLWTDGGAIRCLPDTDRQGRGSQRLYDQDELPFAAFVAALAQHKIPIGDLVTWCRVVRNAHKLAGQIKRPKKYTPAWHEAAFRGDIESYIILHSHAGDQAAGLTWMDQEDMLKQLKLASTAIVINVRETLSPFAR